MNRLLRVGDLLRCPH